MVSFFRIFLVFLTLFLSPDIIGQEKQINLGKLSHEEIMTISRKDWFERVYSNYRMDTVVLNKINSVKKGYRFKVFIGLWCPDSKWFLPKFMRICQSAGIMESDIEIFTIDKTKKKPECYVQKYNLEYLPTVSILKSDIEVNRIVEFPIKSIEKDLLDIMGHNRYRNFHD